MMKKNYLVISAFMFYCFLQILFKYAEMIQRYEMTSFSVYLAETYLQIPFYISIVGIIYPIIIYIIDKDKKSK